jgi:hypothetical protein
MRVNKATLARVGAIYFLANSKCLDILQKLLDFFTKTSRHFGKEV